MKQNRTLVQMYNLRLAKDKEQRSKATAARDFISEVAKVTHKNETTVRLWLSGVQFPDALTQSVLAEHFGTDAKTLFNYSNNKAS